MPTNFDLAAALTNLRVNNPSELSKLFFEAIVQNKSQGVRALLDAGIDINIVDRHDDTPLILAARFGNTEITRLLVEKGADLNAVNKGGETPLISAAIWGRT